MRVYDDFRTAYLGELAILLNNGHTAEPIWDVSSPASGFGSQPKESIEVFGSAFTVQRPDMSIITCPRNPFRIEYGIGQLVWTLAGSDDSDWIGYYRSSKAAQKKAAFGNRLFNNFRGINQVSNAMELLERDSGSRRAYMPIFDVTDPIDAETEIPCAAGFHLFLRQGDLCAVTVMRAQNALASMPMDIFIFVELQRYIASMLGVRVGSYTHMATTLHVFKEQILACEEIITDKGSLSVATLGDSQNLNTEFGQIADFEKEARSIVLSGKRDRLIDLDARMWLLKDNQEYIKNVSGIFRYIAAKRLQDSEGMDMARSFVAYDLARWLVEG